MCRKGMQPRNERQNLPAKKGQRRPQGNLPPFAKGKARLGAEPEEQGQRKGCPGRKGSKRRSERCCKCCHERASHGLERKSEALVLAPDNAPAQPAEIDFGKASRANLLLDRLMREHRF